MRPSTTTSSSGWARGSTTTVFVPAITAAREEGKILRDHPRHDPPRVETRPRGIAVTRRIDLRRQSAEWLIGDVSWIGLMGGVGTAAGKRFIS